MNLQEFYLSLKNILSLNFLTVGTNPISIGDLLLIAGLLVVVIWLARFISRFIYNRVLFHFPFEDKTKRIIKQILLITFLFVGFFEASVIIGFDLKKLANLVAVFNYPLLSIGDTPIGLSDIFIFFIFIAVSVYFSRILSDLLINKGLAQVKIDQGTKYVFKRITEYALIIVGAIIAFQTVGINLSGLAVIFGLLSVGIGFGLQNVTSNFISGIILLFERPIKVGDRIIVGESEGDVEEINIRATKIRSLDNISIIVPNNEFISNRVTNWSHEDPKVRININVGVSYDSNLEKVLQSLKEVAQENPQVLKKPEPEVLLLEFGDSSWNMRLRVWIEDPKKHWYIRSDLNCAIVKKFRENNIEIPYPQRDLHVRSPLPLPLDTNKN